MLIFSIYLVFGGLVFGAKVAETVPFVEAKVRSWKISNFSVEIRQRNGLKLPSRGTHIPPRQCQCQQLNQPKFLH